MVARRAHNPEVVGSSPASATTKDKSQGLSFFLCGVGFYFKNFCNSLSTLGMRIWHSEEFECGQFDDFVRSATILLIIEGYKEGMCGQ